MKLYAIAQCNTVKKARSWMEAHHLEYAFHDYKKLGADTDVLARAIDAFGWETVVNRKGMTWRKLEEAAREKVHDASSAIALMVDKTSVIKRPLLEYDGGLLIGFDEEEWKRALLY